MKCNKREDLKVRCASWVEWLLILTYLGKVGRADKLAGSSDKRRSVKTHGYICSNTQLAVMGGITDTSSSGFWL